MTEPVVHIDVPRGHPRFSDSKFNTLCGMDDVFKSIEDEHQCRVMVSLFDQMPFVNCEACILIRFEMLAEGSVSLPDLRTPEDPDPTAPAAPEATS